MFHDVQDSSSVFAVGLEGLVEGEVINEISVTEEVRSESMVALERMLALK